MCLAFSGTDVQCSVEFPDLLGYANSLILVVHGRQGTADGRHHGYAAGVWQVRRHTAPVCLDSSKSSFGKLTFSVDFTFDNLCLCTYLSLG